jgi:hypothetical protein
MEPLGALRVLPRAVETDSFSAIGRAHVLGQAAVARQNSVLEQPFGPVVTWMTRKL